VNWLFCGWIDSQPNAMPQVNGKNAKYCGQFINPAKTLATKAFHGRKQFPGV
jgi:hypothetical protein